MQEFMEGVKSAVENPAVFYALNIVF